MWPERLTRVVGAMPAGAEPAALEQRADDVPAVADDVQRHGVREGEGERVRDERRLGRLLDRAEASDEPEPPGGGEQSVGSRAAASSTASVDELGDRRLEGRHLAEIHEARAGADGSCEKRRSGARATGDEDDSLIERLRERARRERMPSQDVTGGAQLESERAERAGHADIVSSGCASCAATSTPTT